MAQEESTEYTDKFDQLISRLNARYMVPDNQGAWTVTFFPRFDADQEDFDTVAQALRATPGILGADSTDKGVTFELDFGSAFDPESVLLCVNDMLNIALRDHITASEQRNTYAGIATVTLLFRIRHSDGRLLDMANQTAQLQGALGAEPTEDNEIVLKLNRHYATPEGIRIVVHQAATLFKAHVLEIATEQEVMSIGQASQMIGSFAPAIPAPSVFEKLPDIVPASSTPKKSQRPLRRRVRTNTRGGSRRKTR